MFIRPALLLSLLALPAACGPTEVDTDSATATASSTGSDATTGSTGEGDDTTGEAPTTGEMEFPTCKEPLPRADVGFTFESPTLQGFDRLDADCEVVGVGDGEPSASAAFDLTCVDADAVEHAVHIELRLFDGAAALALASVQEVHVVHFNVDDFTYREVLEVRTLAHELLLYAGAGYELFNADDAALLAPLTFTPVADPLCATEVLAECDWETRTAVDVDLADLHARVFDRDEATLADYVVQLGKAVDVDLYSGELCVGDSVDGLETNLVVYAAAN